MVNTSLLLTGIGLRAPHYQEFLEKRPDVAWIEVHTENFFGEGGTHLAILEEVRNHYPVSLHGVSLSLGSTDELNWKHLKQLADLCDRINPCLISEHLSWSSLGGQYFHDLLPLPYTEETLAHLIPRISAVQEYLGKQILIENVSRYVDFMSSEISEPEFLIELANRSGCGILLDINNIYITETNLHRDPYQYLGAFSGKLVQEFHLAGFTTQTVVEQEVLVDSHNRPVVPAVWDLYQAAVKHLGMKPTMIEWDNDLPTLNTLCMEAYRAEQIMRKNYVPSQRAS